MMKNILKISVLALPLAALLFVGCAVGGSGTISLSIGAKIYYTADGVAFSLVYVPGGFTFPTGEEDSGSSTVSGAYWIGETEVTYELWSKVYTWATEGTSGTGAGQYSFANAGLQGNDGDRTDKHPVTTVNWRDAMVFCNAITEWYNSRHSTNYSCVYKDSGTPIRNSRDTNAAQCDGVTHDSTADGFRLQTSMEWELAARYITDDGDNKLDKTGEYYPGDYASGAYTFYYDEADVNPENGVVDGKDANDTVAVYYWYYDGGWIQTGVNSTAEVKSKNANALGLYDMSGNVWEWCFDLSDIKRVMRGGSWQSEADNGVPVGQVHDGLPEEPYPSLGFRLAITAE